MAIDPAVIGTVLPGTDLLIDRSRLRLFAKATGATDPVYTDIAAARAAGYPDLPVPPTFLCALHNEQPDPLSWIAELGVDLSRVLHGEQSFEYKSMAFAGQYLTARSRITDVYQKKGGALEFLTRATTVTGPDGRTVAELTDIAIIRHEEQR
ncbi:MaoC family dehydratase N-terminal domain-containing protein [Nocardia flavorosea]|uniref:MaoC family dehydratase n=1 Tax=Nocardia flavorosea TaxID=53429 RepID=A0A846YEK2_9NOCA|nr:MaoC family dehydratase N-terminal domain-containing protein [Nocardia flavorosea]NKY57115.1 MaoC family dehydratase [Nocardia flavorosea]